MSLQNTTALTNAISATNFALAQGSKLVVGGSNDGITLSGNFSFQQTDKVNSWTYKTTAGLGPDLTFTGGTAATPTTLEVGGVNLGYKAAAFVDNFALDSLTIAKTADVELVDQYDNATGAGWKSGKEALYLDNLFGTSSTSYGILNLDGQFAYLAGYGMLKNGIFKDSNGNLVDILGAPAVPEPASWAMMLTGFAALGFVGATRRRKAAVATDLS